ncbi:MAG: hypothetical protein P4L84_02425, partial [Isosphaeraceae bacterium]|nr:hypothetical protein [Isosphaeraceae bacterium]
TSRLGEVWYAEGDTPLGPWAYARKVVTHEHYSFYNPKQHPLFDKGRGREIFFEGTYTQMFSGNDRATPRYEYNQIMYKLALSDPRLNLPVPVYSGPGAAYVTKASLGAAAGARTIPFFALDRAIDGGVAVFAAGEERGRSSLTVAGPAARGEERPNFYALAVDVKEPPPGTALLYEYQSTGQSGSVYATSPARTLDGFRLVERPLCRVWTNPAPAAIVPE